jgi:hypothetical protein
MAPSSERRGVVRISLGSSSDPIPRRKRIESFVMMTFVDLAAREGLISRARSSAINARGRAKEDDFHLLLMRALELAPECLLRQCHSSVIQKGACRVYVQARLLGCPSSSSSSSSSSSLVPVKSTFAITRPHMIRHDFLGSSSSPRPPAARVQDYAGGVPLVEEPWAELNRSGGLNIPCVPTRTTGGYGTVDPIVGPQLYS